MNAENRTAACFLREIGGRVDARVKVDCSPARDPACRIVSGIDWVRVAVSV